MKPIHETIGEKAAKYFDSGYSCSESALLALSAHFEVENDLIPRVASGFGGGMGRCGLQCGAFTGAIMGLGVRFGRARPDESRDKLYAMVQELEKRFREQFGDTACRALIGLDLRTPEGQAAARAGNVFKEKCSGFVRFAATTAAELADA